MRKKLTFENTGAHTIGGHVGFFGVLRELQRSATMTNGELGDGGNLSLSTFLELRLERAWTHVINKVVWTNAIGNWFYMTFVATSESQRDDRCDDKC